MSLDTQITNTDSKNSRGMRKRRCAKDFGKLSDALKKNMARRKRTKSTRSSIHEPQPVTEI